MANIAFLPLRAGSKSIPNKNIKHLLGKPLFLWALEAAENSSAIDRVVVATDSEDIRQIVQSRSVSKTEVYWRDSSNAQDGSSTESVMLEFLGKQSFSDEDLFVLLQGTNPFTTDIHLNEAIGELKASQKDSLLSVTLSKRFYWSKDGKAINYDYKQRPRRQDFDGDYLENGAFYISKVKDVLNSKNRMSGEIALYEMPAHSSVELDEPEDWLIAETLLKKSLSEGRDYSKVKLFLTDVDGVLTDAGMYYTENGDELKKFNTRDGKGLELLKKSGIQVGIVTSEKTEIVQRRAKKLGVEILHQGIKLKLPVVKDICKSLNIDLSEVAYVGDDINDQETLAAVGFPACPSNAESAIRSLPNMLVLEKAGGEGVVREYANLILS